MKSKPKKLPQFKSVSLLVDFFDHNDFGDYLGQMPEVQFNVDLKRKIHLFELEPELANRMSLLAKSRKTSSEKLINSWIRQKIHKLSS